MEEAGQFKEFTLSYGFFPFFLLSTPPPPLHCGFCWGSGGGALVEDVHMKLLVFFQEETSPLRY